MNIYTIQLSQWRKLPKEIKLVSIVAKENILLSPTWKIVDCYKKQLITEQEYTVKYLEILNKRIMEEDNLKSLIEWLKGFNQDIALSCFCGKDSFCHRHLAIKYLTNLKEKVLNKQILLNNQDNYNFIKSLNLCGEYEELTLNQKNKMVNIGK